MKKGLFLCFIIILIIINIYKITILNNLNNQIENLINKVENVDQSEYFFLYNDLQKEIFTSNYVYEELTEEIIEDKIGMLTRTKVENEEALVLTEQDLTNIKNKNNQIEKKILQIELQKKEMEQKKLITNFPTYNQFPNYPTGCESVALYILLKYYNIDVTVEDIVNNLKKGALPYKSNNYFIGGDPEHEFIGNPKYSYSYGVYNEPIANVGKVYKSNIISKTNFDFDEVLKLVKQNKPVIVWTTINLSNPFISISWYTATGKKVDWISGEHAMVVFGMENNQVIVSDPYTGTIRYFDKDLFKLRYNYLGKRAIYYE